MYKLIISITLSLLFIGNLQATPANFDIYGVDEPMKQQIYTQCAKEIEAYLAFSAAVTPPPANPSLKVLKRKAYLEQQITDKVKKMTPLSVAEISTVFYPADNKTFVTLDLVKQSERERLPKRADLPRKKQAKAKSSGVKALFAVWDGYEKSSQELVRQNKFDFAQRTCPVVHCIWGFSQSEVKNLVPKLQDGIKKNRNELIELIKNSPDDEERAEAIFILGNEKNYKELASLLVNLADDHDSTVRNNVMRVLGAVVAKHKVEQLDLSNILTALNYPYVTDRNKAGYIVLGLVHKNPQTHAMVIHKAGNTLIQMLELNQPNNHDFAYRILLEISHQTYGERDYKAWYQWMQTQNRKLV